MWARLRAWAVLSLCAASLCALPTLAMDISVTSVRIERFRGVGVGEKVDELIWQGGLVLSSADSDFGGLSGITFTGPGNRLAMVTDVGRFVSGYLIYDDQGAPLGLGGSYMTPIENSKGVELPRRFAKDAEAVDTIFRNGVPAAVRVGFENLTRVADFELIDGKPSGAARPITIPKWLERLRTNRSLEAVCIAPPASPVAGSTLLFTEGAQASGGFAAYMLGRRDKGELALSRTRGLNPTDCAFLPDGDLLVLERGAGLFGFSMQVRRIKAADVQPGAKLTGKVILKGSGGDVDNMEGIAVHEGPDGQPRITIISDDNFNSWERSLLLEFSLPQN